MRVSFETNLEIVVGNLGGLLLGKIMLLAACVQTIVRNRGMRQHASGPPLVRVEGGKQV